MRCHQECNAARRKVLQERADARRRLIIKAECWLIRNQQVRFSGGRYHQRQATSLTIRATRGGTIQQICNVERRGKIRGARPLTCWQELMHSARTEEQPGVLRCVANARGGDVPFTSISAERSRGKAEERGLPTPRLTSD